MDSTQSGESKRDRDADESDTLFDLNGREKLKEGRREGWECDGEIEHLKLWAVNVDVIKAWIDDVRETQMLEVETCRAVPVFF